jgi:hypothetical protein
MENTFNYYIDNICNEVKELLKKKNADYDSSFSKLYKKYGTLSSLIRLEDKINRLENLCNGHNPQINESIDDTLMDIIGYCILTLVERKKEKNEESFDFSVGM